MSKNTTDLDEQILLALAKPYLHERAEAVEQLISNREKLARIELAEAYSAMGRDDMSWGANGVPKEVLKVVPESYKTSTADVPRGKKAFMDFMLTTLRKELDREEPTHE